MDSSGHVLDDSSVLGIDNVGLDINDIDFIIDENNHKILRGILPESPPDSSSEHCLSSPNYYSGMDMSPPELTLGSQDFEITGDTLSPIYSVSSSGDHSAVSPLYSDPVLSATYTQSPYPNPNTSSGTPFTISHAGLHDRPSQYMTPYNLQAPDLCTVDYSQPLQIVNQIEQQNRSATLPNSQSVNIPVGKTPRNNTLLVTGTSGIKGVNNNNSVTFLTNCDSNSRGGDFSPNPRDSVIHVTEQDNIKQEPISSPQHCQESELKGGHRKKRRKDGPPPPPVVSLDEPLKIKSESSEMGDGGQNIQFCSFFPDSWSKVYSSDFVQCTSPSLKVSADKGFNWSQTDGAYIVQKKNHFQLTCHLVKESLCDLVATEGGYNQIEYLQLNFYGVKKEAPDQKILVEQSQTDRSRKKFYPIQLNFRGDQPLRVSVGRLHFSETTLNNMRKKGRPNPEQRYFQLIVSIEAVISVGTVKREVTLVSMSTERIIVRASNPGLFEPDQEVSWSKHGNSDTVYHLGKVGVGTDHSNEALTVHGNIQVTGQVLHPSDIRIKEKITKVDPKKQLENLQKIQVVEYQYKPEYLKNFPEETQVQMSKRQTGVIAQDLKTIIPDAVETAGDLLLPSGGKVNNMLIINKDRLFLENIGAVRELSKVTDNLGHRIEELESHTVKMSKLNRFGSVKSSASLSTNSSASKNSLYNRKSRSNSSLFKNPWIQGTILVLVGIMTMCLLAMAILYILQYQRTVNSDNSDLYPISTLVPDLITTHSTFTPYTGSTITTKRVRTTTSNLYSTEKTNSVTSTSVLDPQLTTITTIKPILQMRTPIGKPSNCPVLPGSLKPCDTRCCLPLVEPDLYIDMRSGTESVRNTSITPPVAVGRDTDDNNIDITDLVTEQTNVINETFPSGSIDDNAVEENTISSPDRSLDGRDNSSNGDSVFETSEHSVFQEDNTNTNVIGTSAVRRAVNDDEEGDFDIDNIVGGRRKNFEYFNLVSDPRSEELNHLGIKGHLQIQQHHPLLPQEVDKSRYQNVKINGKTSKNQINERENMEIKQQKLISEKHNEIILENKTNTQKSLTEEDRSSIVGRKSFKSSGTSNNALTDTKLKEDTKLGNKFENLPRNINDDPNMIVDKQFIEKGSDSLRKKRNVEQRSEQDETNSRHAKIKSDPSQEALIGCGGTENRLVIKTQTGTVQLGPEYCEHCTSDDGHNCTFSVPISRFLTDQNITIIFSYPAVQCPLSHHDPVVCPSSANEISMTQADEYSAPPSSTTKSRIPINIDTYLETHHLFRLKLNTHSVSDLCLLGTEDLGKTFVEIKLRIYRICDD